MSLEYNQKFLWEECYFHNIRYKIYIQYPETHSHDTIQLILVCLYWNDVT